MCNVLYAKNRYMHVPRRGEEFPFDAMAFIHLICHGLARFGCLSFCILGLCCNRPIVFLLGMVRSAPPLRWIDLTLRWALGRVSIRFSNVSKERKARVVSR